MKAKPVIAILLGCLMMVITGHSIVPHHHHSDDAHSHAGCEQYDACDLSGNHADTKDHAGTNDPYAHCHAFNGLEYVLSFKKKIHKEPVSESISICFSSKIITNKPLPREVYNGSTGGAPPEFTGFLGESAGLRAPPAVS